MHGLFGIFGTQPDKQYEFDYPDNFVKRHLALPGKLSVWQITHNKFMDDKIFVDTPRYTYITEGVLLNVNELCQQYKAANLTELVPTMYEKLGKTFFKAFRGSFCGFFYDKAQEKGIVFNDHIGDKMLFYYQDDNAVWFASDLAILAKTLRQNNRPLRFDTPTAYAMLSFGYAPDSHTLISGIKRVLAGTCIEVDRQNQATLIRYHLFTNRPNTLSEAENIERMDALFRQAVQRILDKNEAYGYTNYMPLSAGLDSRMTVWVARQLTRQPIVNITYSQSGYYDETTAKAIAHDLGNQMLFKTLDGGQYLCDLDAVSQLTDGLVNYSGAAQTWDSFKELPGKDLGLIATGMYGDAIIKTMYTQKNAEQIGLADDGAISPQRVNALSGKLDFGFMADFPNVEIRYLYVRGFNCAYLGSPLISQHIAESYSPFSDVDFMEYVYSIPLEQRWGYNLYDKWVLLKYPATAKWAHNGTRKIGKTYKTISICGRSMLLKDLPKRCWMYAIKKLHLYNYDKIRKGHSMNPLDSWMEENPQLRDFVQTYFDSHIARLDTCPELQQQATDIFQTGTVMEKCSALTLLAAMKLLEIRPDECSSHNGKPNADTKQSAPK